MIVGLVLLQKEGVGLGAAFGGDGNFYKKRRGAEKLIFGLTVASAVLFVVSSFSISFIK